MFIQAVQLPGLLGHGPQGGSLFALAIVSAFQGRETEATSHQWARPGGIVPPPGRREGPGQGRDHVPDRHAPGTEETAEIPGSPDGGGATDRRAGPAAVRRHLSPA